jgi:hypothetical protein
MAREYFTRRPMAERDWWDANASDSLARVVIETEEVFDTGVLDENGNKVMAKEKKEPIGFIRFKR